MPIQRIKELIEKERISQKTIAELIGTSQPQLNRWLKGKHKPSKLWVREINEQIDAYLFAKATLSG
jgi:transcriptional regulator with XRE-family HTH domain